MRISHLRLKNWRNFREVDVDLGDRVFLVGPNASGKSNLLDAIRFLRDIAKAGGGLQPALSRRGGISKVRCLAARREPDIEVDVTLADGDNENAWRYLLRIGQESRGQRNPLIKAETVWRDGKEILSRPNKEDQSDNLRLTQTHLEQINANSDFREIARFLESVRYLHLVPQLLKHPENYQAPNSTEDPFGRNFLEMIAKTQEKTRRSRLRKIEKALRAAVPQLKELVDSKDEAGVPHLEAIYDHWRPNAGKQREDQFSDGTLRLIALFWSLLDGEAPLLLEEPELSLHSRIVARLPGLFHQLGRSRRRQLIVSTHSWEMLTDPGIDAQEVIYLIPSKDGTTARVAATVPQIKNMLNSEHLTVADVVLPLTAPTQLNMFDTLE